MTRTRIKICGITRAEDAIAAAKLGVDAIGFMFYSRSTRAVDVATAASIAELLPPFITTVGVFVDPHPTDVDSILGHVNLHMLQFHGNEDPNDCASFARPYIKAVPMGAGAGFDFMEYTERYRRAAGFLLDSHGDKQTGGSGQSFDWELIPVTFPKPLVLAGGLNPYNVTAAIRQTHPFAVDVSSGVESAKGVKDNQLMQAFVEGVKRSESVI